FRTRCARVQAQARVFEDASQSFAIRDAGSTGAVEVLVAIAAHGSPRLSRKTEIGPAGETACPTQFANLWTARKVGETVSVSSAIPPGSQFFTPSDAWGYVECVNRRVRAVRIPASIRAR